MFQALHPQHEFHVLKYLDNVYSLGLRSDVLQRQTWHFICKRAFSCLTQAVYLGGCSPSQYILVQSNSGIEKIVVLHFAGLIKLQFQ